MLRKGWSWWVHREGQIEASLIKKVMRKRAERLAGVQQRETITRGIQGTVRSTVWQDAGCRVDGGWWRQARLRSQTAFSTARGVSPVSSQWSSVVEEKRQTM